MRRHLTDLSDSGLERLVGFTAAVRVRVVPKTVVTMTVVFPTRVIDDWIEAKSVDRYTVFASSVCLTPGKAKPIGTALVFDACLRDDHRPAVPRVKFRKDLVRRPVFFMAERKRAAAGVTPLIMDVVVEADDV